MFEKIGTLAEQAATNVSRRRFLHRLGHAALGVAGFAGSLLIAPGTAAAGRGRWFCYFSCPDGTLPYLIKNNCKACPNKVNSSGMSCPFLGCDSGP